MKAVIIGAGSVGYHLAQQLIEEGQDVVIIEIDPDAAAHATNHLDCLVLKGPGNDPDLLKQADVGSADFFISVTASDEINMIASFLVTSEFPGPKTIARVRNLAYTSSQSLQSSLSGIDYVVNPEVEAAQTLANSVLYGATGDIRFFKKTRVQLRSLVVSPGSFFDGANVKDLKNQIHEEFLIAGIARDDDVIIPHGETTIQKGDTVQLMAADRALEKILAKTHVDAREIKNILLVGGGRIGTYAADLLTKTDRTLKIVDWNYATCQKLAERFPDALVMHGNISEETIYEEEDLGKNDLIINATGNQELNILAGIYAKKQGIHRAVAVVHGANFLPMASSLGIDVSICPKISAVDAIMKFIRSGNVETVYSIFGGRAEIIEYHIGKRDEVKGVAIKDLQMPENTLIVAVTRRSKDIIPDGNFVIRDGDTVIVFTKKESVERLQKIFSE